jgi:hypothetical protein
VNLRAIGCIGLGSIIFILVGIAGLNVASSRLGCPDRLQWRELSYAPLGTPGPSPDAGGSGNAVKLGVTLIGLTTRDIYGPPGSTPTASAAERPEIIAMDCGDGTFVSYRQGSPVPTLSPEAEPTG